MKKIMRLLLIIITLLIFITGCSKSNKESEKNIQIIVYDETGESIFDRSLVTEKKLFVNVLGEINDLILRTESNQHGEDIVSINGLARYDEYNWNYYINGSNIEEGISSLEIKDKDVIVFKLEKFE